MECIIYMGAEDVRRQALNVFRIEMLGAKVCSIASFWLLYIDFAIGYSCAFRIAYAERRY
jgi:hypothetical protein